MKFYQSHGIMNSGGTNGDKTLARSGASFPFQDSFADFPGGWEFDLSRSVPSTDDLVRAMVCSVTASFESAEQSFDHLHPEDNEPLHQAVQSILQSKESSLEFRWINSSGGVRWLASQIKVVPNHRGQPARLLGLSRDVTAVKQAEVRSNSFAQLGQKLSAATTPRQAAETIGEAAQSLFGWDSYYLHFYSPESNRIVPVVNIDTIDGKRVDVPIAYTGSEPSPMLEKVLKEGATIVLRTTESELVPDLIRYGDTNRTSLSLMFVPIRNLKRLLGILSIQSYTRNFYSSADLEVLQALADHAGGALERIYLEQQQHARDHRFSSLFEHSLDGIALVDQSGKIHFGNPATYELLGINSEIHKNLFLCCVSEDLPELQDKWKNLITSRKIVAQFRTLAESGPSRSLELTGSYIPELLGDNAIVLNLRDITEQLDLEAQLRQAQKLDSIGQLAAGVAHEFNNIMTIIQGYTGLVLRNSDLPAGVREHLDYVAAGTDRAIRLTRHLLAFSRKQPMQTESVELPELVQTSLRLLKQVLGAQIQVEFSVDPSSACITADPGMVEQVIVNLAVNARDAMPSGGTLKFEIYPQTIPANTTAVRPDATPGKYVCLKISDTGCGMTPEVLSKIFEPFFTTKEPGKGTGLGLSTVYGVVKQHKGFVEVTSKPGVGTTFVIYWPVGSQPPEKTIQPVAPVPTPGGQETILVVEDEESLRTLVLEILNDFGYQVLIAADGKEAIKIWDEHHGKIDLLFTDLVMPGGISGLDLAREFRKRRPDLRVLCTSGYSNDMPQTREIANVTFLSKPYHPYTLGKVIREVLD